MEGFCTGVVSCREAIASPDGLENAHDMEGASMDIDEVEDTRTGTSLLAKTKKTKCLDGNGGDHNAGITAENKVTSSAYDCNDSRIHFASSGVENDNEIRSSVGEEPLEDGSDSGEDDGCLMINVESSQNQEPARSRLSPLSVPEVTRSLTLPSPSFSDSRIKMAADQDVNPQPTLLESVSKILTTPQGIPESVPRNKSSLTQTGQNSRSLPIHCVIEQTPGEDGICPPNGWRDSNVVLDTYAIIPGSTLFVDIVSASLFILGYSPGEVAGAKGGIQIKNWKTLIFGAITEDISATVEEILGEITGVATLKIQLSSGRKRSSSDDVRDKLLQLLLTKSVDFLVQAGCPVEKSVLEAISTGEISQSISDQLCALFKDWYMRQKEGNSSLLVISPEALPLPVTADSSLPLNLHESAVAHFKDESVTDSSKLSSLSRSSPLSPNVKKEQCIKSSESPSTDNQETLNQDHYYNGCKESNNQKMSKHKSPLKSTPKLYKISSEGSIQSNLQNYQASQYLSLIPGKTRIRTSFDPEHEIPRLQKWFSDNQHPTREQMMRFMHELNILESRKGRRPLDLTNIIYWFKNARAAQRRATKVVDDSFENEENMDMNFAESENSATDVVQPYLSNKNNALYMVPFHAYPHLITNSNSKVQHGRNLTSDTNIDEPYDLSLTKHQNSDIAQICSRKNNESFSSSTKASSVLSEGEGHQHSTENKSSYPPKFPALLDVVSKMRQEISLTSGSSYFTNNINDINDTCDRKSPCLLRSRSNDSEHSSKADDTDSDLSNLATGIQNNGIIVDQNSVNFLIKQENREYMDQQSSKKDLKFSSFTSSGISLNLDKVKMENNDRGNASDDDNTNDSYDSEEELRMKVKQNTAAAVADYAAVMHSSVSCLTAANMAALSLAQMGQPLHIPQLTSSLAMAYYPVDPRFYPQVTVPHLSSSPPVSINACHATQLSQVSLRQPHEVTAHTNSRSPLPSPSIMQKSTIQLNNQRQDSPQQHHSCHNSEPRKRRTRVFIDPLTEIPKLEKWFIEDTHPSAFMIDKYCEELNKCEYRQKFPKLEPKNIQLWFKNHRAKVKRMKVSCNGQEDHEASGRQDDDDVDG